MVPGKPNWQGRSSNGPLVTEYLAERLALELENYAVAGATSGEGNLVNLFLPDFTAAERTGMKYQLANYLAQPKEPLDSTLFLVWVGSNDLALLTPEDTEELAEAMVQEAIGNITTAVEQLLRRGARSIVLASRTPRRELDAANDRAGQRFNHQLESLVNRLQLAYPQVRISFFDAYTLVRRMVESPSDHGFEFPLAMCVDAPACRDSEALTAGSIAQSYVFWDIAHLTTRTHQLLADELLRQLISLGWVNPVSSTYSEFLSES